MSRPPPKPIVTSWDVFDTLLARFTPHPHAAFHMVEKAQNAPGFVARRLDAQSALDRLGAPYVLHDIYRRMVADGTDPVQARTLLKAELAAERALLVPIRRNVARVDPLDLIVSDMYLSPETIASFLFEICDLNTHRPIVRSNWGKHTGTIWPLVLGAYVVRRHVGDNPVSDAKIPSGFGIACELVEDSRPTAWETKLEELGLGRLALIQREVRLRAIPPGPLAFHAAVAGPYLTILACFALHLVHRFGADADFAFLSRSADELARVFAAVFAEIPSRGLDISRRLADDAEMGALFAAGITPATVVVDMVGTGRSFFRFAARHGDPGHALILFAFLDLLLTEPERAGIEQHRAAGRFVHVCRVEAGAFSIFEHLLQAHYPPVSRVQRDAKSGGVVRAFGAAELDRAETDLIAWKSETVTMFCRALRQRGMVDPGAGPVQTAMLAGLQAIMEKPEIAAPFTSFVAREKMDWA